MSNKHKFANSTSIEHVDYHDDKSTMEIKFTSGVTYHYPNCNKAHYDGLKAASSPGGYFHSHIRKLGAIKIK